MTFRKIGGMFAFLLLAGAAAFGQEFRGRVQGAVTDTTGGLMPGVSVTLRNTGTGVDATRATNDQGRYVFDYVDPGTYALTAEMKGFKRRYGI